VLKKTLLLSLASLSLTGCLNPKQVKYETNEIYFSHALPGLSLADNGSSVIKNEPMSATTGSELLIYFDNDSASIRPSDTERLLSYVLAHMNRDKALFLITGHTDSNHSDKYNLELSHQRALATQNEMSKMGVSYARLVLRSLGETAPVASNVNEQGRQDNRRVSIAVIDSP